MSDKPKTADNPRSTTESESAPDEEASKQPKWLESDPFAISKSPTEQTKPLDQKADAEEQAQSATPSTAQSTAPAPPPKTSNNADSAAPTAPKDTARKKKNKKNKANPINVEQPKPFIDDRSDETRQRRRRRIGHLIAFIIWPALTIGVLYGVDYVKPQLYFTSCKTGTLLLQKSKQFPWPFGKETYQGPWAPVAIGTGFQCAEHKSPSEAEAKKRYIELLINFSTDALSQAKETTWPAARKALIKLLKVAQLHNNSTMLTKARQLRSELAFREGKRHINRGEQELRSAIQLIREAQQSPAGSNHEEIRHLMNQLNHVVNTLAHPDYSKKKLQRHRNQHLTRRTSRDIDSLSSTTAPQNRTVSPRPKPNQLSTGAHTPQPGKARPAQNVPQSPPSAPHKDTLKPTPNSPKSDHPKDSSPETPPAQNEEVLL